ncbi:uncharacterized protein LOC121287745 [Carcharodon carcharias]|uniref:uncharacterized protein LOC121287745 n=1 Tax=Carcharodon carcharias TaxID=13397 RepID=UPI001B7E5545|nr:uncharacterized protein LOC121287745 [Carcharodon carcharias]XP_041061571.1 uncharacterized protein LOC121287745 [Carcharodon carcharias]XP_041061572.1 uncharacterized protein LOC121287745 [Carcharodon carcharias]
MESDYNEANESSPLNLMPRHRELIPTPCGPMKQCSELSFLEKSFVTATILSLFAVSAVTIKSIISQVKTDSTGQTQEDFTISMIQLIGIVFCFYYVLRGTFQENRQELIAFILSILLVVIRSVVNFSSATPKEREELKIRFGFILGFGVFLMIISIVYLAMSPSMMAFRVSGAMESDQSQYVTMNLCFSMVTFDLQAQLCLCVLVLTSGVHHVSHMHARILGVGIIWAILKAAIGLIAILKGKKVLVWIFMVQNLPELAYLGYLLHLVITEWGLNGTYVLEAGAVTGAFISVAIKVGLVWSMIQVSRCFGQRLHKRMFNSMEPSP